MSEAAEMRRRKGAAMNGEHPWEYVVTANDIVIELLRYTQQCFPVVDFPSSDHPAWKDFVGHIAADPKLKEFLPPDFDIGSLLSKETELNPETNRIRVNKAEGLKEQFLRERFSWTFHRMYLIMSTTRGLIELG